MAQEELKHGLRALARRTRLLRVVVWLFMLDAGLLLTSLIVFELVALDATSATANVLVTLFDLGSGILPLLFVMSMIAVLFWVYRAYANLGAAEIKGLRYTPAWSIGWFFLPVGCLHKPLAVMQELTSASRGERLPENGDVSWLLTIWWGLTLVGLFLVNMAAAMAIDGGSQSSTVTGMISLVALIGSAGCLLHIVGTIAEAQTRLVA